MIVLTHRAPVNGKLHCCTILDDPSLQRCSVATMTFVASGLATRSIAPPMPLKSLPGIMKLARSPAALTWRACGDVVSFVICCRNEFVCTYAEDRNVDVAAADHAKGLGRVKG